MDALKDTGAFRQALGSTAFDRSFKPNYSTKKEIASAEWEQVISTEGKRYAINEIIPVAKDTAETTVPDMRGCSLRDQRLREQLQPFARDLWDGLGNNEYGLTAASRLVGEEYNRVRPSTLLFGQFAKLFPTLFAVTGASVGMEVRRVRKRVRGKQKATV